MARASPRAPTAETGVSARKASSGTGRAFEALATLEEASLPRGKPPRAQGWLFALLQRGEALARGDDEARSSLRSGMRGALSI